MAVLTDYVAMGAFFPSKDRLFYHMAHLAVLWIFLGELIQFVAIKNNQTYNAECQRNKYRMRGFNLMADGFNDICQLFFHCMSPGCQKKFRRIAE